MADKKPRSGAGSDNPGNKPTDRVNALVCTDWEVLLMDYLDGAFDSPLRVKDAAAFEAHRLTCAACSQLLQEAKRGSEWLHFLDSEPEVPSDLVSRILEKTSGNTNALPAVPALAGVPMVVAQPGWQTGWLPGLERHAAQSRWIMTVAMAFFSIAFTLNLTGVRLSGFHLSDLKPTSIASGLQRQFYAADKGVNRYYNNLRFVYELESRVRQMKRDMAPVESSSPSAPAGGTIQAQPQQQQPRKSGGSAKKIAPGKLTPSAPAGEEQQDQQAEPVMASFHRKAFERPCRRKVRTGSGQAETAPREFCSSSMYGTKKDRAERSLA